MARLAGVAVHRLVVLVLMTATHGMLRRQLLDILDVMRISAKQHGHARITPDWQGHSEKHQDDQLQAAKHVFNVSMEKS